MRSQTAVRDPGVPSASKWQNRDSDLEPLNPEVHEPGRRDEKLDSLLPPCCVPGAGAGPREGLPGDGSCKVAEDAEPSGAGAGVVTATEEGPSQLGDGQGRGSNTGSRCGPLLGLRRPWTVSAERL